MPPSRPPRIKPSGRFLRSLAKVDGTTRKAATKALEHLLEHPELKGLGLEPLKGRPSFWKIRVNDNYRIFLQVKEDDLGRYYLVADIAKHDVYKKRR